MRLAFANFMNRMENFIYFIGFALSIDFFYFTFTGIPGFLFTLEDGLFNILFFNFYENAIAFSLFFFIVLVLNGYLMLSYLGLYGVFSSCLLGVFTFWVSLLININDIMINNKITNLVMFKWFTIGNNFTINFEFLIDPVSFSFAFLTTSIALFVNIYAFSYFRYEPNVDRLMLFLNSFVISMVILVLSGNLIMLFLGWELIGLTSFLLINFWSTRVGTLKAAFKAYAFNKYSDFLMFVGIIITGLVFNDFNISNILVNYEKYDSYFLSNIFNFKAFDLISFFFLGAAFIKSAQIGLHIWLPDSMEAPVPASALIHSATLVSAGIFLILRLYPIFENSSIFYLVTPIVGISTAFYGGLVAFYQNDLKRILAYSTISHCGFLMFLTTLGSFEFTILYLYVHGFFKAIAFLCVGNIIRFNKNYQDVRRMGQLWKYLPFEFSIIFLSLMNLSGLPFFFGFYIKHLVFISVDNIFFYQLIYAILFLAALTGTFYFYKVVFYSFFDTKKARKSVYSAANRKNLSSYFYSNSTLATLFSISALTILAYIIIFFFFYELILTNNNFIDFNFTFYKTQSYQLFNSDFMSLFNFGFLNWIVVMCIVFLTYIRWNNTSDLNTSYLNMYYFSGALLLFIWVLSIIAMIVG
jgi:NADH:ubiquinone oxidoreductase subunit 5 (subunit L)/multisubunit Na+/H+ antiporter MnhA subunit